jgi:hypothetical protein
MRDGLCDDLKSFAKFETNPRFIAASSRQGERDVSPEAPLLIKCVMRLNHYWLKFYSNFRTGRLGGALLGSLM